MNEVVKYLLMGIGCISSISSVAQEQKKYNILFIMSDDHTQQMLSCYDKRYIETPNIDRIANDGVRFVNSFVANSISGPSRACMLTGKHSCQNGFFTNSKDVFDGSQQTFPKLLQKAGYETALIGKWHLTSLPTGFDYWQILPGQGEYYNPGFIVEGNKRIREKGYVTNIITDKAIDWLENKRDVNKPFCLLVHHKAAHRNWMADTCDLKLFEDETYPLPETFYDDYEGRKAAACQEMNIGKNMLLSQDLKIAVNGKHDKLYRKEMNRMSEGQRSAWNEFYDEINNTFNPKKDNNAEWKFQRYVRDYKKTVKSLDRNVGRILDYLEKKGLMKNTLVVYTSDQGFYLGEHGWFDKRFMYEESMRTPLIMRLPDGLNRKGDIDELVQNIDYAPTFLELAGVEVPDDIQGISLLPLLKGDNCKWRDALYYHYYEYPGPHSVRRHFGIRTERYKLMRFYGDEINEWEFYDLKSDPIEMKNLYNEYKGSDILIKLKKRLKDLQKQYNDTIVNNYD